MQFICKLSGTPPTLNDLGRVKGIEYSKNTICHAQWESGFFPLKLDNQGNKSSYQWPPNTEAKQEKTANFTRTFESISFTNTAT